MMYVGLMQGEGSPMYHASKHAVYGYTRSQCVSWQLTVTLLRIYYFQ